MALTSDEEGMRTPWTIADVAKSLIFVALTTVLTFGGIILLRPLIPAGVVPILAFAGVFVSELTMLVAVWFFALRKYRLRWSDLGFRAFDPLLGLALVSIVLLGTFGVNIFYVQVITLLGLDFLKPPPILPPVLTGVWRFIVPILLASLLAPLVEEAFFRGFVLGALKRRFGFWLAAIGSGLLFALAHLQLSVFFPIFLLGVMLAWLFERIKSIWPCIGLHFMYNTIALMVVYSSEASRSAV